MAIEVAIYGHSQNVPMRQTLAMHLSTGVNDTFGRTYRRGEAGYEEARRATSWNARIPARYPAIIVQANNVHDVVAAIRLAKSERLRVTVRSGGHSWAVNHLRDGGLLLDVSRLDDMKIDKTAMKAIVGPGRQGHDFAATLLDMGLFFPAGHCRGVCLGGYLLQGGFGWHGRALGPACMSVEAIDVVTAEGDIVRASEKENSDLYWAARGAGPGFFGVVTAFHLRLYPKPKVIGFAAQHFPIEMLEDIFSWAHAIGPRVPTSVEFQILMSPEISGIKGPGLALVAPVLADNLRQALNDVSFLNDSPYAHRANRRVPFIPSGLKLMYHGVMEHYPSGHRYAVDNMWTHAPIKELMPGLKKIATTLPAAPSHMLWLNWAPPKNRPDMAFSVEDDIYIALYSVWKDQSNDKEFASWPVERMKEMAHLATGCQLADENLGQRPAKFVSDENLRKLDQVRAAHDPNSRFHEWMGRP